MLSVELPYPPSINHYWRRVGCRTLISREGRQFRAHVIAILAASRHKPLTGKIQIDIGMYPPDRRRRDIDNIAKAVLDALAYGGLYSDDSQIYKLTITKHEPVEGGKIIVRLSEM